MVLHDINQAILYSDYIIGLRDGKVLIDGDPRNVINEDLLEKMYGIRLKIADVNGEKIILNEKYSGYNY